MSYDGPIFDIHHHVQEAVPFKRADGSYAAEAEKNVAYHTGVMDRAGVRAAAIHASLLYERPNGIADTRRMNDYVAWYRNTHNDRFVAGTGTVEPYYGVDVGVAEIERCATELRLDGMVWHHHFSGTGIDDRRMTPFLQALAKHNLPAFIHVRGYSHETTSMLESLALRVPECTIITLCPMNGLQQMRELRVVGERCPNVMFNTSLLWPLNHWVDTFVGWFGSERVIFGSDVHYHERPSYDVRPPGLDEILTSPVLTDTDRRNILWDNAARLFPAVRDLQA